MFKPKESFLNAVPRTKKYETVIIPERDAIVITAKNKKHIENKQVCRELLRRVAKVVLKRMTQNAFCRCHESNARQNSAHLGAKRRSSR